MGGARLWARTVCRRRWVATVLLAVFAGLAGGMVLTSMGVARRSSTALDRYLAQPGLATKTVIACPAGVSEGDVQGDPGSVCGAEENVRAVAELVSTSPAVSRAVPAATLIIGIQDRTTGSWTPSIQFGLLGAWDGTPNGAIVIDGRSPTSGVADEVLINESMAAANRLSVGDVVTAGSYGADQRLDVVAQGQENAPTGPHMDLRVVGLVRSAEDLLPKPEPTLFTSVAWWDRYGSDDIASYGKGVLIDLVDPSDRAAEDSLRAQLSDRLSMVSDTLSDSQPTRRVIELQTAATWAVALAALAAAFGFVGQALNRLSAHELVDRGALVTLGMTRSDVVVAFVLRAAPIALGAGVIAAGVAVAASPIGPIGMARSIEIDPGLNVDGLIVGLGAAVVTALTVVAAAVAALFRTARTARSEPRPVVTSAVRLPISARAGVSFLRRRDSSALPGAIVGTALAIAVAVFALGVTESHHELLAHPDRFGQTWQVVAGNFGGDDEVAAGREKVDTVVGVGDLGLARSTKGAIKGRPLLVYSFPIEGMVIRPLVLDGRAPATAREVALGTRTFEDLRVRIGDEVSIDRGLGGDPIGPLTIVGRVVNNDGVDTGDRLSEGALVTNETFDRVDENTVGQSFLIGPAPGVSTEQLIANLRDGFGKFVDVAQLPDDIANLDRVAAAPAILAGLVGVLAAVALINSLVGTIGRRRRDIGVLRALGFTRRQVLGSTSAVAAVLVVAASVIGVPMGLIAARWGWTTVQARLGVESGAAIPIPWVVLVPVVTLLIAQLIAVVPGLRAARLHAAEALRSE